MYCLNKRFLAPGAVLALLFLLSACRVDGTASGEAQRGRVLDAVTEKPIAGAIVVARWQGHAGYSGTVCFHVETAVTDDRGVYAIPAWEKKTKFAGLPLKQVIVTAHKAGYQWSSRYAESIQYLEPFRGSKEERLKYLSQAAVSCSHKREIEINLLPLYKALYEEAKNFSVTKEDKLKVLYRLRDIERLELGTDQAWENFRQRKEALR